MSGASPWLKRSQWISVAMSMNVAKKAAPKIPAADGWNGSDRNVRRKKYAPAPYPAPRKIGVEVRLDGPRPRVRGAVGQAPEDHQGRYEDDPWGLSPRP